MWNYTAFYIKGAHKGCESKSSVKADYFIQIFDLKRYLN